MTIPDAAPARRPAPSPRARAGAWAVLVAILIFTGTAGVSLVVLGAAYDWQVNMISDLGDDACHTRGGRWICSPGFALFNAGLILTGVLLGAAGWCLTQAWGRLLAGSIVVMGAGLIVAAVFPAGDDGALHLVGVVLGLVVPGLGLLVSGIRPETAWLAPHRVKRGVLAAVALLLCAESRLPEALLPRGASEVVIVGCLLAALALEAARVLAART